MLLSFLWCRRRDSNPQGITHMNLNHARLPIPPLRHSNYSIIIPPPQWRNWIFSIRLTSFSLGFACSISDLTFSQLLHGVLLRHLHFIQLSFWISFVVQIFAPYSLYSITKTRTVNEFSLTVVFYISSSFFSSIFSCFFIIFSSSSGMTVLSASPFF